MRNIFISYKYEDKDYVNGLIGLIKNTNNTLVASITMEEDDVRIKGKEYVKTYIKNKMKTANTIVLLIGRDTHSSLWVQYEIEVANQWKLPIVVIKIESNYGEPYNLQHGNNKIVYAENKLQSFKNALDSL